MFADVRGCSWMFVNIDFSLMSIDVHRFYWMFVDVQYLFLRLSEEKTLGGALEEGHMSMFALFIVFSRCLARFGTHSLRTMALTLHRPRLVLSAVPLQRIQNSVCNRFSFHPILLLLRLLPPFPFFFFFSFPFLQHCFL